MGLECPVAKSMLDIVTKKPQNLDQIPHNFKVDAKSSIMGKLVYFIIPLEKYVLYLWLYILVEFLEGGINNSTGHLCSNLTL